MTLDDLINILKENAPPRYYDLVEALENKSIIEGKKAPARVRAVQGIKLKKGGSTSHKKGAAKNAKKEEEKKPKKNR